MKQNKKIKLIREPTRWNELPCGEYYQQSLEHNLKFFWPKLFGIFLIKIGALSADIKTDNCTISNHINIGLDGQHLQIIANPYKLPLKNKSTDACLLAHTLSYVNEPNQLLQEVNRVLIDDGWLVITTFNLFSFLGLSNIVPILFHYKLSGTRLYTHRKILDWLKCLNFEILYRKTLQILPWKFHRNNGISRYFPEIGCGCLSVIIARKRTFPINFASMTNKINKNSNVPVWATKQI